MPDVFILGFTKCATTSLYDQLCRHPGVADIRQKEPHFHFSRLRGSHFVGPADADTVAQMFVQDPTAYDRLYRQPGLTIDASAMSIDDLDIVSLIDREQPSAKYIVMLRDPLSRAYSAFSHMVRDAREERSFREAMEDELNGMRNGYLPIWRYIDSSRYVERIQGARRLLGDRLLVVRYEDYIRNNGAVMADVARFVGIDNIDWTLEHSNRSGNPKSKTVQKLLMRKSLAKSLFVAVFPRRFVTATKRLISSINIGEKSQLDRDDTNFFKACIRDELNKIDESTVDAPILKEIYSS